MNNDQTLQMFEELEFILIAVMEALGKDDMKAASIGVSMALNMVSEFRGMTSST